MQDVPMWLRRGKVGEFIREGDSANAAQRWAVAERAYLRALSRNPRLPHIWIQYGHSLKEQGKLAEAEQAYWESIALNRTAESYLQLGHVLKIQSRLSEARLAYATAHALDPGLRDPVEELARLEATSPRSRSDKIIRVPFDIQHYARERGIDVDTALAHYVADGLR